MSRDSRSYLVVTAVGPDRPGLVNAFSSLILEAGANLEDSRMAILGGEFALLVLVSGTEPQIARVEERSPALGEQLGLKVLHKRTAPEAQQIARRAARYDLEVTGVDRPGIVHAVSTLLATRGINVASFESRIENAPESGTELFVLEAALQIPTELGIEELEQALTTLCDTESLDFTLKPRPST
jgi:glycine cleavage system transcriptional repressor